MSILSVLSLVCGLAFFLYGMHVMSAGLEKLAGGRLERTLKKMTSNPFKSLLLGAGITIAIQSSSAMTVMLVGLVNSGIMELGQTIGVIMGSNIGTTLTTWLLALAGIEGDNIFLSMLKPENFSAVMAIVGIFFIMGSKKQRRKDLGNIFVGFAVLMYGMTLMSDSVSPLRDMPQFADILTAFNNPILGVIVGTVVTGVIQSSAASVGILQALSLTGGITFGMAIPIIMGQNIGTCVTAIISSFGVNKNAKRVSVVHISFNIIGTVISLSVFYLANAIFNFSFVDMPINPLWIAVCHTIFNVFTTAVLLPFTKKLEKIAYLIIKETGDKQHVSFIDSRLLATPSFAISECYNKTSEMATTSRDMIFTSIQLLSHFNQKQADIITETEDKLDWYEDKLGTSLVKLSSKEISDEDSKQVSKLLHTIGDFERLGDHALNIKNLAEEIHTKKVSFSDEAKSELTVLTRAIEEILTITIDAFTQNNVDLAHKVEPLEQVIDNLTAEIKARHINRLQSGKCTLELGFILSDLSTNFERVSDHCSNIAVAMIEVDKNAFKTHQYLNEIKSEKSTGDFEAEYLSYKEKYRL